MKKVNILVCMCSYIFICVDGFPSFHDEEASQSFVNVPLTWKYVLSNYVQQGGGSTSEDVHRHLTPIQNFMIEFGKSLDKCNRKLEESAEISGEKIRDYLRNAPSTLTHEHEDINVAAIIRSSSFNLAAINFEEEIEIMENDDFEVNNGPDDPEIASGEIWFLMYDIVNIFDEACDDLPLMIDHTEVLVNEETEGKIEEIVNEIFKTMTVWTHKWTNKVQSSFSEFIDSCILVSGCDRNLKLMVSIISNSLEESRTDPTNVSGNVLIALHNAIGSSQFWNQFSVDNNIHEENAGQNTHDLDSSVSAKLQKMISLFSSFFSNQDDEHDEYFSSIGLGGLHSPDHSSNSVPSLEESQVAQELTDYRMQRLVAAAISVLRFPWQLEDPQHAELRVDTAALWRTVPATFVSLALESRRISGPKEQLDTSSPKLRKMMAALSPAIFRFGGSSANFLTFDPSQETTDEMIMNGLHHASYDHRIHLYNEHARNAEINEIIHHAHWRHPKLIKKYNDLMATIKNEYSNPSNAYHHQAIYPTHPKYKTYIRRNDTENVSGSHHSSVPNAHNNRNLRGSYDGEHSSVHNAHNNRNLRGSYDGEHSSVHNVHNNPNNRFHYDSYRKGGISRRSISPSHPKFGKHVNSINHWHQDRYTQRMSAVSQEPNYRNFTMDGLDFSGLLSLCRALNWTLLFDLNQFYRDSAGGWDSANAAQLVAAAEGEDVVWQIGNEPNAYGHKYNWRVTATQMADDVTRLRALLEHYNNDNNNNGINNNDNNNNNENNHLDNNNNNNENNDINNNTNNTINNDKDTNNDDNIDNNSNSMWEKIKEEFILLNGKNGRGGKKIQIVGPDVTRPKFPSLQQRGHDSGGCEGRLEVDSMAFMEEFLAAKAGLVDAVTWHQYYMCGRTATLGDFMSPEVMDRFPRQLAAVVALRDRLAPDTPIWITETGSAWGGGAPQLSDGFAGIFLWLDKLGVAARDGAATVARQSLYGGAYALLDQNYDPNPDFWVSVLHKRLVGGGVLRAGVEGGPPTLRLYAHCLKPRADYYQPGGVVVFGVNVGSDSVTVGLPASLNRSPLLQYLLTPPRGGLRAKLVLLNGVPLTVAADGSLPPLPAVTLPSDRLTLPPAAAAFWLMPAAAAPACAAA